MRDYKTPIVIIHKGDSEYLPATLLQLRHSNPETPVYLIGDDGNKKYQSFISHYELNEFFETAAAFRKIYVHFSTNGYEFELFCIQRWFVLNDFMKAKNLSHCLYLDSDVLVFCDVDTVQKTLSHYGMTVTGISAHTNFINDKNVLSDFCGFIWNLYSDNKAEAKLRERYEEFLKHHPKGGISDMTLFTDYRKAWPQKIGDLAVIRNSSVFDITLDTVFEYESDAGFKKIIWNNSIPFVKHLQRGDMICFHTLHFQGKCKKKIYQYTSFPFSDYLKSVLWRARFYKNKIVRKFV